VLGSSFTAFTSCISPRTLLVSAAGFHTVGVTAVKLLFTTCCMLAGQSAVLQLAVDGWVAVVVLQRKQP
jgi:hypothetical protein